MIPRVALFWVPVVGFVLGASAPIHAQLAAKSPFMPAQAAANAGPTAGAPLEYRGYMETSEGMQFRLYDPAKKSGTWVKLNERSPDIDLTVKQHDTGQQTLTIEYQGKTLTLEERKAKVVSSGVAVPAMPMPMPAAPVPTNLAPAVTQAVVLNPTPADEQRRLDAVATEVARRRALREQATQQMNSGAQGAIPPVVVPSAMPQQQPIPRNVPTAIPPGNYQQPTGPGGNARR